MISKDDFKVMEWYQPIDFDVYRTNVTWQSPVFNDAKFYKTVYLTTELYKSDADNKLKRAAIEVAKDDLLEYIEKMRDAMLIAFDLKPAF